MEITEQEMLAHVRKNAKFVPSDRTCIELNIGILDGVDSLDVTAALDRHLGFVDNCFMLNKTCIIWVEKKQLLRIVALRGKPMNLAGVYVESLQVTDITRSIRSSGALN